MAYDSELFNTACEANDECGQLKCVEGFCQQCVHGATTGGYSCVAGQLYVGTVARIYADKWLTCVGAAVVGGCVLTLAFRLFK
jgi:hypothetical protein